MKNIKKSPITTGIAFGAAFIVLVSLILVFIETITISEMLLIWSGLGVLTPIFLGIFGKDANTTHSDFYVKDKDI